MKDSCIFIKTCLKDLVLEISLSFTLSSHTYHGIVISLMLLASGMASTISPHSELKDFPC